MDKFKILGVSKTNESDTDEDGKYTCDINIGAGSIDGTIPNFVKTISVESLNSQTGTEVDNQRIQAVNNYINQINS